MGIILGVIGSFGLFFIYDVNDASWKSRKLQCLFGAGGLLLVLVTISGIYMSWDGTRLGGPLFCAGSFVFLFSFLFLIYTLFFALPLESTYGDHVSLDRRKVCSSGMYALCRHPGVWWMAGMYAGICLAMPGAQSASLFFTTTICNISYVCFQDIWTFPRIFEDYESYRHSTPFLVPTRKSFRACRNDLKKRKRSE